jgi:hypothetical protein
MDCCDFAQPEPQTRLVLRRSWPRSAAVLPKHTLDAQQKRLEEVNKHVTVQKHDIHTLRRQRIFKQQQAVKELETQLVSARARLAKTIADCPGSPPPPTAPAVPSQIVPRVKCIIL